MILVEYFKIKTVFDYNILTFKFWKDYNILTFKFWK